MSLHLILSVALPGPRVPRDWVATNTPCSVPTVRVTGGRLGPSALDKLATFPATMWPLWTPSRLKSE